MVNVPQLLADLVGMEGIPFHHQGRNAYGVDCAGMLLYALQLQGVYVNAPINYPMRDTEIILIRSIADSGLVRRGADDDLFNAGDVILFRLNMQIQHLAVAMSDTHMIHATRNNGVRQVTISPAWRSRYAMKYIWV